VSTKALLRLRVAPLPLFTPVSAIFVGPDAFASPPSRFFGVEGQTGSVIEFETHVFFSHLNGRDFEHFDQRHGLSFRLHSNDPTLPRYPLLHTTTSNVLLLFISQHLFP
jgi:hypothetical protein